MHTVTKISEDSESAFYIYFLICNKTKNKQLPISKLLALNFSFYLFAPTIDKEPIKLTPFIPLGINGAFGFIRGNRA